MWKERSWNAHPKGKSCKPLGSHKAVKAFCQVKRWIQFGKINLDLAKLNTAIEMLDDTWTTGFSKASPSLKTKFNCRKFYSKSNAIPDRENTEQMPFWSKSLSIFFPWSNYVFTEVHKPETKSIICLPGHFSNALCYLKLSCCAWSEVPSLDRFK